MGLLSKLNNSFFTEKKQEERSISGKEVMLKSKSLYLNSMVIDTEFKEEYKEYLNTIKNKPYLDSDDKANFRTMTDLIRIFCFHKKENILNELDLELVRRLWFLMYRYIKAKPQLYFNKLDKPDQDYLLSLLNEVYETRFNLARIKNKNNNDNPFNGVIKVAKEAEGKEDI